MIQANGVSTAELVAGILRRPESVRGPGATWRFRATRKDTSEKTARKPVAGHKGGNREWRQQLGSQAGVGAMAAAGTGTSKTAQPGTADSLTAVPGRDDPAATAGAGQRS